MKVAIAGASGFVGKHLVTLFDDPIIVARKDFEEKKLDKIKDADVIINLVGAPIIKRWSEPYKKTLISSRIDTTKALVEVLNNSSKKHHFISTSAVGAYPSNQKCDEECSDRSEDFLGGLTRAWEDKALQCTHDTTILRFGVVIGKEGGALKEMLLPFKLGLGGQIGDGKMMFSWIDIRDLKKIYQYVIEKNLTGIYNATSPYPVTNLAYTKALGKALHRPTIFFIPEIALKLMFGEASSVLIDSKEAYPKRLLQSGFEFTYPNIEGSLSSIFD